MTQRPYKILIVDDDEVDRLAARRALLRAGLPMEVEEATSNAGALAELQHADFDCMLLDYQLPDGDGLAMLQKLRVAGLHVPVIMLTGHGDEQIAVEVMKAGAVDYLSKGRLAPDTLARSVRTTVRVHRAEAKTRQAEEERRESEDRFRVMADSAPVLIWMSGPDGKCTYFNQGWLEFTGHTLEREGEDGWMEGIHPDDLARYRETYQSAFDARRRFRMEYRLRRADGVYRWLLNAGVPRFLPEGTFAGFIGTCVDITERKQVEEALVRNQAHIAALNQDLRQTMSVMHDRVRNTLQILAAMVDIITLNSEKTVATEDVRQLGAHIHIMATVQDLLMQQAKKDGRAHFLSAHAILDRLIPLFDSMARNCRLQTEIEEIWLPAQQGIALPIVVSELLSNAFKHGCRPGGVVNLRLYRNREEAVLEVQDEGPGFPVGFDPSHSAHAGLELVERLGQWDLKGRTQYLNLPKGGARVTVWIPLMEQPDRDPRS